MARSPMGQTVMLGASFIPGTGAITKAASMAGKYLSTTRGMVLAGGAAAAGGALLGQSMYQPSGAMPPMPSGMMPMDATGAAQVQQLMTGKRGAVTMPPLNMAMIQQLEAAGLMIGFSSLRTYHKSPSRRHVVVHPMGADGTVATFALEKSLARRWGLWKPAAKPVLSVGQWHSIRNAKAALKVLHKATASADRMVGARRKGRGGDVNIVEKGAGDVIMFPRKRKAA